MLNMITREGIPGVAASGGTGPEDAGAKRAKAKTRKNESGKENDSDSEPCREEKVLRRDSARRLRIVRSDEVPTDVISRSSAPKKPSVVEGSSTENATNNDNGLESTPAKQLHTRLIEREKRKRTDSVKRVTVDWDDFVLDEADEENVNIISIAPSMTSSSSSPSPASPSSPAIPPSSRSDVSPSPSAHLARSQSCSPSAGRRVHKRASSVGSGAGGGGGGVGGPDFDSPEVDDDDADDEFSQSAAGPGLPSFRAGTPAKIIEKLVLFAALKQGSFPFRDLLFRSK